MAGGSLLCYDLCLSFSDMVLGVQGKWPLKQIMVFAALEWLMKPALEVQLCFIKILVVVSSQAVISQIQP